MKLKGNSFKTDKRKCFFFFFFLVHYITKNFLCRKLLRQVIRYSFFKKDLTKNIICFHNWGRRGEDEKGHLSLFRMNYHLWPKCLVGLSVSKMNSAIPKEGLGLSYEKTSREQQHRGGQGHLFCCYFLSWSSGGQWKSERWSSAAGECLFGSRESPVEFPSSARTTETAGKNTFKSGFLFSVLNTQSWRCLLPPNH